MKRRRENRREREFFTVKAGLEGNCTASLCLDLPISLESDFSNYFSSDAGVEKLNDFFFSYTSLTEKQKEIFQLSIYNSADDIISVADLFCMLKAFKRVFVG